MTEVSRPLFLLCPLTSAIQRHPNLLHIESLRFMEYILVAQNYWLWGSVHAVYRKVFVCLVMDRSFASVTRMVGIEVVDGQATSRHQTA